MKCEIPKEGCQQRTAEGDCKLNIVCQKIVEKCIGCARMVGEYCKPYSNPASRWVTSKVCPMATHVKVEAPKTTEKIRAGQQKQKKIKK